MWIRKPVSKQRTELWLEALVFAAGCVGVGVVAAMVLDSSGLKARLLDSILAMIVFVAAFALIHLRRGRVVICESCQHPRVDCGKRDCGCGRELVDVREMHWVNPDSLRAEGRLAREERQATRPGGDAAQAAVSHV